MSEGNQTMKIWIKTDNSRLPLEGINKTDTVKTLKERVKSLGIDGILWLVHQGKLLHDSDLLNNLEENDQLYLLKKLHNLPPQPSFPTAPPARRNVGLSGNNMPGPYIFGLPPAIPQFPQLQGGPQLPAQQQQLIDNFMRNFLAAAQNPNPAPNPNPNPNPNLTPFQALFQNPLLPQPQPQTQTTQARQPSLFTQTPVTTRPTPTPPTTTTTPAPTPSHETPPSLIQKLVEMGFPENRARKALILNSNDQERAVEWLFEHSWDADIDTPLTPTQISQLKRPQSQQSTTQAATTPPTTSNITTTNVTTTSPQPQTQTQTPKSLVEEAISLGVCTYSKTKDTFHPQQLYMCVTCDLAANKGCCVVCAKKCHAGHQISGPIPSSGFFCDCGAGEGKNPCKCLSE